MAVDKHPSRKPGAPRVPPATSTTAGTMNKIPHGSGSGQEGVSYGFHHEIGQHKDHHGTMNHHFHDHGHAVHPHGATKAHHMEGKTSGKSPRPGDQKHDDEPG